MSRSRLAMWLAGLVVAIVSVVALKANGYQNAPLVVLGAGLVALGIVAKIGAKNQ